MAFTVSVPTVAGVPVVNLTPGFNGAISLLSQDAVGVGFGAPQWGIYSGGAPVVTAESVVSFDFRNEASISDYPVERGAFESFDKVAVPYSARVRFSAGGGTKAREALLSSIAAIAGDLNLYDVVTPEAVYSNANVTHFDYQRANVNGRGLLVVDVWLEEIRQTAAVSTGGTAAPSGADPVNSGTVQPVSQNQVAPGLSSQGFAATSTGFNPGIGGAAGFGPIPANGFANQPLT